MSQRLGDLLVKEKVITTEQLDQATKIQKETNCRLGSALVKLGFLTDEDVTNFLSRQYGVPAINLSYFEIDASVVKLIPFETAKRYQILPLSRVGASLTIAMVDPDERLRHGRYQVHDRLQHRAGGGVGEFDSRGHRKGLRHHPSGRPRAGHAVDDRHGRRRCRTAGRRRTDRAGRPGESG